MSDYLDDDIAKSEVEAQSQVAHDNGLCGPECFCRDNSLTPATILHYTQDKNKEDVRAG